MANSNNGLSGNLPGTLIFGVPGKDGATFTPSVDDSGNLSWSNDGGLENPETKNIRGPQGATGQQGPEGPEGPQGEQGEPGEDGGFYTPSAELYSTGVMKITWNASKTSMAGLPPKYIQLPEGKSAYEYAVESGYEGTEEEFAELMNRSGEAVRYTAQELTDEQKAQARENIGAAAADDESISGTLDVDINVGAVAYHPTSEAGKQFGYYWESGYTRACLNPLALYMEKGATYRVSLTDYSNYKVFFHVYRPSLSGVDFSYAPNGSIVWFPGEYERLIDTGWLTNDYSYTPDEENLILYVVFARKDEGAITEDDLLALKELFSLEYTSHGTDYVPANMGSDNGNRYLVTDEYGNVVVGDLVDGESDVPTYWTEYLEAKLPEIRAKVVEGGVSADAFMYFADHHIGCMQYLNNANNTKHIIDFVREHTPIQKAFHGGDILNTTANQTHDHVMNWLWVFHDDYIRGRGVYPVIGNHEISTQYDTSGNHISFDEAYSILFRDAEKTANTGKKLYYFVDNPSQKIRYIVLDTESETIGGNTAQLQWFIDTLAALDEDWTAVMMAHNFSDVTAYDNPTNPIITQIAGAYNNRASGSSDNASWDFADGKGVVACLICGHIHRDGSGVNNGILVINVASDCGANVDNKGYEERQAGDVSEQAVELFFVNTKNRTVETIRLGYGENRVWSYDSANETTVVNLMENAAVVRGGPGGMTGGKINYYYENGTGQATLNPMCFYVEAGGTLSVSLSDYSTYRFVVYRYSIDESAKDADFSFTEGTSKNFGVAGTFAYGSGWQEADLTLEIEEAGCIALLFKKIDYSSLTVEDTAAIKSLLTATVTYQS